MSRYGPQIAALARRAERDRAAFDRETASPADTTPYLHEGAGQAIWVYLESRTGGRLVRFSQAEFDALEGALHTWLELYAACHGVEMDVDVSMRTAAEALLETRNIEDTAQILTGVPPRQ